MLYETSDKVSAFGNKPYVKKGYYPGKLLKVEEFLDRDGKPKEGKYGLQLIFEFAVYKKDSETDAPIEPLQYCTDKNLKTFADVIISKFVYHKYKKPEKDKSWKGEYQTAITPNSAITKVLKALGWVFTAEGVDPEKFVGNWVELNLDDYTQGEGSESYTASTIKDINLYEGPEVKNIKDVKATEKPKQTSKQMKHEEMDEKLKQSPIGEEDVEKLKSKIVELKKLNEENLLTDEGLKQAVEQLEAKIGELEKK